jgi:hypothetical protein
MRRLICLCVLLPLAAARSVSACSIPVFRYALERWNLSPYEVIVFHKGELGKADLESLKVLEDLKVNVQVTPIDVAGKMPKRLEKLWKRHAESTVLPHVIVRLSDGDESAPYVYSGALDSVKMQPLLDSPARQTLVARLQKGDSAVFVLLESGDRKADDEAATFLEKELARLKGLVKLPEQTAEGPQLRTTLPLKVEFSVVRVQRSDKLEEGFVRVLLSTEEDLEKVKGPIVFPVFGRGRALCSIFGKELESTQFTAVVRFLCGECSCQVKELNPGVDLLLTADWPAFLDRHAPAPLLVPREEKDPPKKK